MFTSSLVAKDRSTSLTTRLGVSPMKSIDYILGYSISVLPIVLIQNILFFMTAMLLGLNFSINIIYTILVSIPISLLFISLGILIGTITENGANTGTSQTPNQTPSGTSDLQAAIFNAKFNNYIGNITGSKINELLRIATESVTNDPSHPITINSNTITDLSEIMPTETYMITPAYDSAGYINSLNIDKIM